MSTCIGSRDIHEILSHRIRVQYAMKFRMYFQIIFVYSQRTLEDNLALQTVTSQTGNANSFIL